MSVIDQGITRLEQVARIRFDKIGYANFILKSVRAFKLWSMGYPRNVVAVDIYLLAASRYVHDLGGAVRVSEAVVRAEKAAQVRESVCATQA